MGLAPLSRRRFIQSVVAASIAGASGSAFAIARQPFVMEGEFVSSIVWHLWDKPRAPCSISMLVHAIRSWDGVGYPIILARTGWRVQDRELFEGWYDFEWSNLRRDVPAQFWQMPGAVERYPNVHAYVREQRFGEDPDVMRRRMILNQQQRQERDAA